MVKLFVGQSTRSDAHNLDDLYDRWLLRIAKDSGDRSAELSNGIVTIPEIPEMPEFADYDEARDFRRLLDSRRRELQANLSQLNKQWKGLRKPNVVSEGRFELITTIAAVDAMQKLLNNYFKGSSWFKDNEVYREAIKLIDSGLLSVGYDHDSDKIVIYSEGLPVATISGELQRSAQRTSRFSEEAS